MGNVEEIRKKIIATTEFYANKKLLKNKLPSKKYKIRMYRIIIQATLMYTLNT